LDSEREELGLMLVKAVAARSAPVEQTDSNAVDCLHIGFFSGLLDGGFERFANPFLDALRRAP
jgi:hypothetical protein